MYVRQNLHRVMTVLVTVGTFCEEEDTIKVSTRSYI